MTPEAIRIITQLRKEFYSLFAKTMKTPVNITNGSSSTGNPPMVFWVDDRQRLNYLRVYVHTAPDELLPERPFILRVSVNRGGGIVTTPKWKKGCRGLNQDWYFELTLLPEEILDFLPWVVNAVESHAQESTSWVQESPHALCCQISNERLLNEAWTQKAYQENRNSELGFMSNSSYTTV